MFKSFTLLLHWLGVEMSVSFGGVGSANARNTRCWWNVGRRSISASSINNCNHVGNENAGRKIIACLCVGVIKDKPK